jgi:hypothetical protein
MLCSVDIRCANFSNFPMVTPMLLPISAALLANSDLLGFPSGLPFAAAFCESVRRDCLCAPTFDEACRRCTCVRTERNSLVRSCIEETAIASDGRWSESQGKDGSNMGSDGRVQRRTRLVVRLWIARWLGIILQSGLWHKEGKGQGVCERISDLLSV